MGEIQLLRRTEEMECKLEGLKWADAVLSVVYVRMRLASDKQVALIRAHCYSVTIRYEKLHMGLFVWIPGCKAEQCEGTIQ